MSSIDQRVVEMKFNNGAFAKGIADTLAALTRLQNGLKLPGATQGAQQAVQGINQLGQSTGLLGGKFTAMQAVALGALASIGAKAVATGSQVVKSLTIGPVLQGFQEYETNMNSIQTILANTKQAGTGLAEVNAALDEMNLYSDKTIYNFSEMAKNVGTFTAAGVDLKTATGSIKGIANLAALSGSNSQQAAGAMYQLSQEIAAGKVTLMGWNSVVNAGMGGSVFQRALAETAVAMGKMEQGALKLEGPMKNVTVNGKSFRDSISAENGDTWLTSDVLTATLQQFTGDLSDAELAAQGFSAAQIQAIKDQAAMAVGAATEVKTFTGLMDTLKEGVASGWSQTFRILIGDFEEAKQLFTSISNTVGGVLGGIADRRNALLQGWKEQGGRDALIEGLKNGLTAIAAVVKPVIAAFRQIFPPTTVAGLVSATQAFARFTATLKPSAQTVQNIQRTFAGLFAVLGIGWELLKAGVGFFADLFGSATKGSGGILTITATVGDFLVALHEAIKGGDLFGRMFDNIAKVVQIPIQAIQTLINWIASLFTNTSFEGADELKESVSEVGEAADRVGAIFERVGDVLREAGQKIGQAVGVVIDWFKNLGSVFANAGWEFSADTIMQALGLGAGVGLGALILKALNGIKTLISNFSLFGDGGGGLFDSLTDALDGLTGSLKAMQMNLQANALLKIAAAIGILAVSLLILSGIPANELIRASTALAVVFTQLGVALAIFSKIGTTMQAAKLNLMGAALIFFAGAVLILTAAVKALSDLSWGELIKGLGATIVLIGALAGAAKLMQGKDQVMIKTGAALMLLAVAVKILASAVEDLSGIGWAELAKGLGGVAVLLGALGLFSKFAGANAGGIKNGAGIVLLAVALKLLASAVGDFAQYNWEELAQGMVGIGVGLKLIAGAMSAIPAEGALAKGLAIAAIGFALGLIADAMGKMADISWVDTAKGLTTMAIALRVISSAIAALPKGALLSAAAIFVAAASLGMIADALGDIGSLPLGELAKGLIGLAAALTIISVGIQSMTGAIAGAAALLVAAAALRVLLPVIQGFAAMSWGETIQGLIGLAGVFVVLGAAGLLLAPVGPVLIIVGVALGLIGAAVFLAAAGVMLFSTALVALAAAGAAGAAAFKLIMETLISLIPIAMEALATGIIAFARVIGEGAPALVGAFVKVLNALLQAIIDVTPKLVQLFQVLLRAALDTIIRAIPQMVDAGMRILIGFLQGIANNINRVVTTATNVIVNFLNGIANNIGRIVTAGANLIIRFLEGLSREIPRVVRAGFEMIITTANGIADEIRRQMPRLMAAGANIADAIIDGIISGIKNLAGKAFSAVKDMASGLLGSVTGALGINSPSKVFRDVVGMAIPEGIAVGVKRYGYMAEDETVKMGRGLVNTMGKTIAGLGAAIENMGEFQPVITPILDLSSVQSGARGLGALLNADTIDLNGARINAGSASAGYAANLEALAEILAENSGVTQNFTQVNNSPKALPEADIYRGSKNLLSKARRDLSNA